MPRVTIGSDHAGVALRRQMGELLSGRGWEVQDLGPEEGTSVDYPDYARRVARSVAAGEAELGLLVCGTGIGMSIAANKIDGVRAALLSDALTGRLAKEHNDANVIVLGARVTGSDRARSAIEAFLDAHFTEARHVRRVGKIMDLEGNR